MSSNRGNVQRTRPQKYKNRTAFKNDLHDKTPQQKKINSIHVCEVCQHCKGVIEWKIKYKKYKPLSQAKTCVKCQQRNVKKAYHVICRSCAIADKICAKCLKSSAEVEIEPSQPSEEEQVKLKVEMDRLIKSLPERKRRTFLRFMAKGETISEENGDGEDKSEPNSDDDDNEPKEIKRIPHTREALLKKIEALRIEEEDEDDLDLSDSECDTNDSDENDEINGKE